MHAFSSILQADSSSSVALLMRPEEDKFQHFSPIWDTYAWACFPSTVEGKYLATEAEESLSKV